MRKTRLVALVAALPRLAGGMANAAPSSADMTGEMVQTSEAEALQRDFEAVVRSDPTRTLEGVRQDYQTTVAIDGLNQQLKQAFPGVFGDIKIVHGTQKPDAVVHLSGAAPAGLLDLLNKRSADLDVVVDQELSQDQLEQVISAAAAALRTAFGISKINLAFDYQAQAINVTHNPSNDLRASVITSRGSELVATALAGLGLPSVPVQFVLDKTAGSTELITGGTAAGASNGKWYRQGPVCTYSFAGSDRSGRPGLLSARHCTVNADQTAITHEDRFGTVNGVTADVKLADARFHYKSGKTIRSDFIYERNQGTGQLYTRRLQRVDIPDMNEDVCMFGWRTRKQVCSTVAGYDATNGVYENLILVNFHYSTGGDSGGPWFYGPTGFGIHEGGVTPPPPYANYMLMSPITDALASTGVRLAMN